MKRTRRLRRRVKRNPSVPSLIRQHPLATGLGVVFGAVGGPLREAPTANVVGGLLLAWLMLRYGGGAPAALVAGLAASRAGRGGVALAFPAPASPGYGAPAAGAPPVPVA